MAESTIPVDLLNPGQVFACLGILEASDILLGAPTGAFDWGNDQETCFRVAAADEQPLRGAWSFMTGAAEAERVCFIATRLYQLGRGIDMAWAYGKVLDEDEADATLA